MTLFELLACVAGYNAAHGGDGAPDTSPAMSDADALEMLARHRATVEG
jgi:hypothetical protein